jgi:hypothetical protein
MANGGTRTPVLSDRQGFNQRWYAPNIETVYLPTDTSSLVQAVNAATNDYQNAFSISSGRHCYEGFVYNDGIRAVIDVSGMTAVGYDSSRGYFVEAGNSNWSMYRALLNQYNLTIPAGSCYSVGVGGHICGGGYGLLSRLYGLTVDWLTGVEIVVRPSAGSPATAVYVSNDSVDPDATLYWAVRGGGGGNFGVISRYYFQTLPTAPAKAAHASFTYDWADFQSVERLTDLIRFFELFGTQQSPSFWPQFSALLLTHQSAGQLGISIQMALEQDSADLRAETAEQIAGLMRDAKEIGPLRPRRALVGGHPIWAGGTASAELRWYTYLEALQVMGGSGPNQRGKYKSAYMKKAFPDSQIAAIYAALTADPGGYDLSSSLLQVDSYGCKINTMPNYATAIPQRSSVLKLQYQTYWQNDLPVDQSDPAQDAFHLQWIRDFYVGVYAEYGGTPNPLNDQTGTVDGCYYNYPDADLGVGTEVDNALWLYFLDNYANNLTNLKSAKMMWDPQNYFNHAQSIPLS